MMNILIELARIHRTPKWISPLSCPKSGRISLKSLKCRSNNRCLFVLVEVAARGKDIFLTKVCITDFGSCLDVSLGNFVGIPPHRASRTNDQLSSFTGWCNLLPSTSTNPMPSLTTVNFTTRFFKLEDVLREQYANLHASRFECVSRAIFILRSGWMSSKATRPPSQ